MEVPGKLRETIEETKQKDRKGIKGEKEKRLAMNTSISLTLSLKRAAGVVHFGEIEPFLRVGCDSCLNPLYKRFLNSICRGIEK